MAAAYEYADGGSQGRMPDYLYLGQLIDRWGVAAVLNRGYIGAGEGRRIMIVERIVRAVQGRDAYRDSDGRENWAEWATANPAEAELLALCAEMSRYATDG